MDKETKSILKIAAIALAVLIVVFGVIYATKSGKSHSHGGGEAHSH